MKIDLKTARALTSEEAQETLLLFRNLGDDPLAIQESFRGLFPKKIAEALGELRALRRRATTKFSRGLDMFFTKEQLQQSSSESVACYRARRFREAGVEEVWDPCCGIGSDAIALARLGIRVHLSDKDPSAVHFAEANARVYGVDGLDFRELDCGEQPEEIGPGVIFLDPSRRRGSRRIMSPEDWSPAPERIAALLAGRPGAGLKLSPAVAIDQLLEIYPEPDEIEVISLKGEAKETVFWYGCLACGSGRRATSLPAEASYAGAEHARAPVGDFGPFLHDPDPALVHAGLLGAFAEERSLRTVDPEIAYLAGDEPVFSPFLDTFRVLAVEALDPRKMRKVLRELGVGSMQIRKRGIAERPLTLEQRLLPKRFGDRRITLLAARVGDRHLGVVAEPAEEA
ncbi:MAG: SAM-dependent methyltransferase [Planctomycetota bacterium]|nr:MAG: SAM-dependent methyltransferase [Planctomycetota bacterium]